MQLENTELLQKELKLVLLSCRIYTFVGLVKSNCIIENQSIPDYAYLGKCLLWIRIENCVMSVTTAVRIE